MALPPIHRVVTGHDVDGKAVIVMDGGLPNVVELQAALGMIFHEVWETQGAPTIVDNGPDPSIGPMVHGPPPQGARIRFVDLPPDASYQTDEGHQMQALFEEVNDLAGLTVEAGSPHPMMHRTESIDYGVVIDGEVHLVLDDSEILLRSGSVVVQRGTNHAWANRTDQPCRMLFIQIDGKYDPVLAAALAAR